jgi:hypothetical protein
MASHAEPPPPKIIQSGPHAGKPQVDPVALALTTLPPDHPLPQVLDATRQALTDSGDSISFEDAHKIKRLLDEAVNWDSPAKKQAQQITKGFRQTLRESMASHEPYNAATAAYQTVAKQYEGVGAAKLHKALLTNPESVVGQIDWRHPAQAQLLKDITTGTAAQAGEAGAQQGEAAFNAVRAAYTHEKIIAKGPVQMANEIDRMEASNAGQEFIKTFYGDPQGQTVWNNLKQIATSLRKVQTDTKTFAQSDLARATEPAGTVRDIGYSMLHGNPITKIGAISRFAFGKGTGASELIQWASYAPARTQFLIKHVLTGPDPGMAFADMVRWFKDSKKAGGNGPDTMAVSHDQPSAGGPPRPRSVQSPRDLPSPPPAPR